MSDFIVTVKDTKTGKINPYLSTKEDNHFWYELDPESFPYMDKDLTPEREAELDSMNHELIRREGGI